MNYSRWGEKSF